MSIFAELKRRNVFKVAAAYVVVGWLIMQAGEVMAPALNLPEWVNSMLAFFLILGFPLAMFFAWAFEMTPEGIKKEKDVDRSESITQVTGQKLNHSIIALLVVTLGFFAWDKFLRDSGNAEKGADLAAGTHSIAVLPLADMSQDGNHEYFSDGLTEELLNILSKISDLRVAGRTSSFAFKGKNEDLREIGQKLNVESILEGSVRKDDVSNRVRITLQLVNVQDGYHLWSETYDRQLNDIFAIQEEVAREVASALRVTLLGEDQARIEQTASAANAAADVYDLYLQGLNELHKAGHVNLDRAAERFGQALALEPDYLPARLGLLEAWAQQNATGAISQSELVRRGMPVLEPLLKEYPQEPQAQVLLAKLLLADHQPQAAEAAFKKALELAPGDASKLQEYGRFLFDRGETTRGLALIETAATIEPYNAQIRFDQCQTHGFQANIKPALEACKAVVEIVPDGPQGYYGLAIVYQSLGDLAQGIFYYSQAIERDPDDFEMVAAMAMFWVALGDAREAEEWLNRAEAVAAGEPIPTVARVLLLEYSEQYDRAGELVRRALSRGLDDRHGSNLFLRRANARAAVRSGNYEQGLAPYQAVFPWAFASELEVPDNLSFWDISEITHLTALMKLAEPLSQRPAELSSAASEALNNSELATLKLLEPAVRASVAALNGNMDEALAQLQNQPLTSYWRPDTLHNPALSLIHDEPEFLAWAAEREAEAERQRLLAYELMGLNP